MRLDLRFRTSQPGFEAMGGVSAGHQSEALGGTAIIPQALFHNQIWD